MAFIRSYIIHDIRISGKNKEANIGKDRAGPLLLVCIPFAPGALVLVLPAPAIV